MVNPFDCLLLALVVFFVGAVLLTWPGDKLVRLLTMNYANLLAAVVVVILIIILIDRFLV